MNRAEPGFSYRKRMYMIFGPTKDSASNAQMLWRQREQRAEEDPTGICVFEEASGSPVASE